MKNITKERYRQIYRMQKIQKFQYENESLIYEIENSINLNKLIEQEQNKIKCFTIGQLFIITNKIVDLLLKVYQISNISKLDMNSIYVNVENNEITFTNIHINKDLVPYESNLYEIIDISYQIFLKHQEFLIRLNKENKKADLSKRIQYITEFSNQVLDILKTTNYHKELNQFVQKIIKDEELTRDNFKDVIEIPTYNLQDSPDEINQKLKIYQSQQQKQQLQQQQYYLQQQEYEKSQQLYQLSQEINCEESNDLFGQEEIPQNLGQSAIHHMLYSFIEQSLKQLNLREQIYEDMLKYFIQNFKNLQQYQITEKIGLLKYSYDYPTTQDQKDIDQSFLIQWQDTITSEFIKNKDFNLNVDYKELGQKLHPLFRNQWESQSPQIY